MEKTAAAIYLAGHGSLVFPRLVELQYRRIQRYREALRDRLDTKVSGRDVFVDLQLPKYGMGNFDIDDVPGFARLRDSVVAGLYRVVFIDLDEVRPGLTPDHESDFVRRLLTEAGAKVLNAFADDENVFQSALRRRFGPTAWAEEVTDGDDVICFFPSLASEVGEAMFRQELAEPSFSDLPLRNRIAKRLYSLKISRPYSGGGKPFVGDQLSHEWRNRKKE
jgi:hypothetical protein